MDRCITWMSCGVLAVVLAGCGGGGVKVHPVSGKVTIGGQPGKNLLVTFAPVDSSLQTASGLTKDDGSYELNIATGGKGAQAGKYKVVLGAVMAAPGEGGQYGGKGGPPLPSEGAFPKEYGDAKTSPKEVEVTSGTNTIDIDV